MDLVGPFGEGVRRASRILAPLGALLCLLMIGGERANAWSITDYTLIVVGESSTGGNDSVWGYTSLDADPVELDEVPNPPYWVNGFATDPYRNRVIFVDDNGGDDLYEYDLTGSGTFSVIGNISTAEIPVSTTSGGGGWYQGKYYYWDDSGGVGSEGLIRVNFNTDGSVASVTTVFEPDPDDYGDFGDLAIDEADGTLYATSSPGGGTFDFWSMDLNDLASGRSVIQTGVPYQQFSFDNSGQLVGVEQTGSASQNWYEIDLLTGNVTATYSRLGGFDVFDMANGGLAPVPEPRSLTLLGLALAALALRGRIRRSA